MNRAVSGTLTEQESGRPIPGLRVVAVRIDGSGMQVLGGTVSGDFGRFRIAYTPLAGPVDLSLLVISPDGRLLFTEPVHRAISGAELRLEVGVPRSRLRSDLH